MTQPPPPSSHLPTNLVVQSRVCNPTTILRQQLRSRNSSLVLTQVPAILPQAVTQPGTFTFQLPGELEKESKAKKGITKLMLLHICGSINYKTLLVTEITLASPLLGMEVVLSQPRAARSTSLSDLVCQTLDITKESDHIWASNPSTYPSRWLGRPYLDICYKITLQPTESQP